MDPNDVNLNLKELTNELNSCLETLMGNEQEEEVNKLHEETLRDEMMWVNL